MVGKIPPQSLSRHLVGARNEKKNMHISWLGNTAIKLQAKPFDKDIVVVIDPYKQTTGTFPRSLAPDIGLYTRGEKDSITLSGEPFVLACPGEIENKGILVTSVQGHEKNEVMFRVDAEQISVGHLGLAQKPLTDAQLEVLSGVDVLIVPVGNGDSYDAEMAVKAVNTIEPRIVIPMGFKSDNDPKAKSIDDFLKEIGAGAITPEKKAIIKKKDLPQEETQVIVLSKE